jgi:hypothetical protein
LKLFSLCPKSDDYSDLQFLTELLRLPASFEWPRVELIVLRLCPVAMRLAQRTHWPLIRQGWFQEFGVDYMCELRLEHRELRLEHRR